MNLLAIAIIVAVWLVVLVAAVVALSRSSRRYPPAQTFASEARRYRGAE